MNNKECSTNDEDREAERAAWEEYRGDDDPEYEAECREAARELLGD